MKLADAITELLGNNIPIRIECFDGSHLGPSDAETKLIIRSSDALRHMMWAPGELGIARAWVAGDIDLEGNIFDIFELRDQIPNPKIGAKQWATFARLLKATGIKKPAVPNEEVVLHGRRHSPARDQKAISHHYNVSNEFYELVLGPSMTYSCAVWSDDSTTLEQAQAAKYELICRKLGLVSGMRLLDVGCGWGSMAMHAAKNFDVDVVGVTISTEQAEFARKRVADAGLSDRIDIRIQDYRDIDDGPFDAISSIGMFEHVGEARLGTYFEKLHGLLSPQARLLNHGITRPPGARPRLAPRSFVNRYVFPDGELHEIAAVQKTIHDTGLEIRHVENLREHYNRTLHAWVKNLEDHWDEAVDLVGIARAKIWLLYMAGSAEMFKANRAQIYQVLAVKSDNGVSNMPARPNWD